MADPGDPALDRRQPSTSSSLHPLLLHPRLSHLHHHPSSPSLSSSFSSTPLQKPQSQFSLENRVPLRKRALTASASAAAAPESPRHTTTTTTTTTTSSSPRAHAQHRRSVPNFSLPHIASQTASSPAHPFSPLSTVEQNTLRNSIRPREVDLSPADDALNPNASKRRRPSAIISQKSDRHLAKDTMPSSTLTYSPGRSSFTADKTRAVNGAGKQSQEPVHAPNGISSGDDTRSRNEDIFLNIARSDSGRRDSLNRSEFRRSRFGSLQSPTSRINTSTEMTPSPEQLRYSNPNPSSPLRTHHNYGSISHPHSSVSAHPLEDHTRSRYAIGPSSRSSIGVPRSRLSRTSPDTSPQTPASGVDRRSSLHDPRLYDNPSLSTIRSSRQASSEVPERVRTEPEKTRHDGTESTLSTNAPSTVWDELEDLKSRIRKLELTGKLPPSSQAAISSMSHSGERPRTATTTATTLSSSPNHRRKTSSPSADSHVITVNQVHPILQSALGKTRSAVSNEVYKALEATVNDATTLSTMLGSGSVPSSSASMANGYGPPDRQSRRKADSVCRGLTELCLALSDDYFKQQKQQRRKSGEDDTITVSQPNGNATEPSTPTLPSQRSSSFEPGGVIRRRSTNRVTSRLEARRASFANSVSPGNQKEDTPPVPDSRQTAQPEQQQQPSPQATPASRSRLSRLSTSLRTRRGQSEEDGNNATHGLTLSRAMTDISTTPASTQRFSRQRLSNGYTPSPSIPNSPKEPSTTPQTPHQPPPSQIPQQQPPHPRTPSLSQTGIPLRRSFMAPASYTPTTPRSNIQAGSRRYGLPSFSAANGSGNGNGNDAAEQQQPSQSQPPQQTTSQTRIIAPSTKIAASYTPIQQNRTRTNSLGTRRFGIRPRPTVNTNTDSIS